MERMREEEKRAHEFECGCGRKYKSARSLLNHYKKHGRSLDEALALWKISGELYQYGKKYPMKYGE